MSNHQIGCTLVDCFTVIRVDLLSFGRARFHTLFIAAEAVAAAAFAFIEERDTELRLRIIEILQQLFISLSFIPGICAPGAWKQTETTQYYLKRFDLFKSFYLNALLF